MQNFTKRALVAGLSSLTVAAASLVGTAPVAEASTRTLTVGIGDSFPAGSMGNENWSYVHRTAKLRTTSAVRHIPVNRARGGWTTNDVLYDFLNSDTLTKIKYSDEVIITIGANDVIAAKPDPSAAATDMSSYRPAIAAMKVRLEKVLAQVTSAKRGNVRHVVVTTYNNIYVDGSAGNARGAAFVKGSNNVTLATNAAIRSACLKYKMACVEVYPYFNVPNVDILVTADGTHPSSGGHAVYTRRILAALKQRG